MLNSEQSNPDSKQFEQFVALVSSTTDGVLARVADSLAADELALLMRALPLSRTNSLVKNLDRKLLIDAVSRSTQTAPDISRLPVVTDAILKHGMVLTTVPTAAQAAGVADAGSTLCTDEPFGRKTPVLLRAMDLAGRLLGNLKIDD